MAHVVSHKVHHLDLFLFFFNKLRNACIQGDCSMFANDLQLKFSGPLRDGPDIIADVNIELDRVKR